MMRPVSRHVKGLTMISDEYKDTLKAAHAEHGGKWGTTGGRNFGPRLVQFLKERQDVKTVLDFGCGQRTLEEYVKKEMPERYAILKWENYDPGINAFSQLPDKQYDLIVSSDVLEHVEPTELDQTLQWMYQHTRYYWFHLIACDPCYTKLPDGRNAHLIVQEPEWWVERLRPYGTVMYWSKEVRQKRRSKRTVCLIQIDKA